MVESTCSKDEQVERLAKELVDKAQTGNAMSPMEVWAVLQKQLHPSMPFAVHQRCYQLVYEGVQDVKPCWIPDDAAVQETNIAEMMKCKGFASYEDFYQWSVGQETRNDFWMESTELLDIQWETKPAKAFNQSADCSSTDYFPGGSLNITDSCFHKRSPEDPALVYAMESRPRDIQTMSFATLGRLSNQIANALQDKLELSPGDAVAICMPMTPESIAIYLGIVKAGLTVVSIADSFSAEEIATRCRLGDAKAIFTQDVIYRGAKFLPLYTRVLEANDLLTETDDEAKETKSDSGASALRVVVLPGLLHAGPYPTLSQMHRTESGTWNDRDEDGNPVPLHKSIVLRDWDYDWHDFMRFSSDEFTSVKVDSMTPCNILFSSGTTGEPKAIVWSHSTPIKCAVDGYYHHDLRTGERVAWPTNIGWMMGPWLLFQLINGCTVGIFNGVTSTDAFCQFVDEARISMVGVIPSLVKQWLARNAVQDCDWSCVRRFSSTGEASDPVTYLWLMSRVPGYAPVVEYCGGTEIGGSFLSSTMVQPNVPSMFSSPVLGSQILLLDSSTGKPVLDSRYCSGQDCIVSGEVALVPPAVGLSTVLLNRNNFDTYFKGMPTGPDGEMLRRHGDEIQLVRSSSHLLSSSNGEHTVTPYFRALGRCDDTMNIGGIKVGSVEIERVCNLVDEIQETAAIAVSGPAGGPSNLVIYVVLSNKDTTPDKVLLRTAMQKSIKSHLNPLFGISDVVVTDALPRTASNKVMRRLLRDDYVNKTVAA